MNARLLASVLALLLLAGAAPPPFRFPDTDAGRRAAEYVEAFDTGREEAVRAAIEKNVSKAALAQRSVDDRLAIWRDLHAEHGTLTPLRLLESADDHVRFTARTAHGLTLAITVLCEPEPPHFMVGLRIEDEGPGGPDDEAVATTPLSDADAVKAWGAHLDSLARIGEFSGIALLAKDDEVRFEKAYGEASRASHAKNRVDTRFNLGSLNKLFTKVAIAQLVAQGKVRLDDTIDRYLPDYPSDVARRVTVGQLLEHRGGIGDVFGDAYDRMDKSKLRRVSDWIPLFRDQPLAFEPGTKQEYSNGGYVLLGAIVEKASGEDYYDYVRRHVYRPAGMTHTDHYAKDDRAANLAEGYTRQRVPGVARGSDGLASNEPTRPMRGSPAGGGYSTVEDLLAFARALRQGKLFDAKAAGHGFEELTPGPQGRMGLGAGGGAPGLNAALEMLGDYTIVVLANLDPPTAERAAAALRRTLPGIPSAGPRVRIGAGAHGPSSNAAPARQGPPAPERTIVPEQGAEVAMTRSEHLPAVQVMIDGKGPFRFALDTGGGGNASVDSAVAAALGLEVIGQARSGDPSGRNLVTVDLVRLASIEVGGARFEGVEASVRAGRLRRMGEPVDGILGFGLFQSCLLTLDYPGNRLRVDRGELPAPNGDDVIAFDSRHGVPSVRLQVDSVWVDADVDAGAPGGFTVPASLESKIPFAATPRVVAHGRTIGNDFEIRAAEIKGSVRLGGFEWKGATVGLQPVFPVGNIGSRVLSEFRVTFDQKNGRMRLSRAT